MGKRTAIKSLKKQLEKIDGLTEFDSTNWLSQTASYVKKYFGEDSIEFSRISNFAFVQNVWQPTTLRQYIVPEGEPVQTLFNKKNQKEEAKQFLQNCIETIQFNGILKKNFLNKIDNNLLLTLIPMAASLIFAVGVWLGHYQSDQNKLYDLQSKYNELKVKDSLKEINGSFSKDSSLIKKK